MDFGIIMKGLAAFKAAAPLLRKVRLDEVDSGMLSTILGFAKIYPPEEELASLISYMHQSAGRFRNVHDFLIAPETAMKYGAKLVAWRQSANGTMVPYNATIRCPECGFYHPLFDRNNEPN